jgi:nucleotide-binding universal stress UspA family protein
MRGTIVCGVNDTEEGRGALELAAELSERLGLRLVLAHVVEGIASLNGDGDGDESVTMKGSHEGAARLVARLAAEHGLADQAELRSAVGDAATLLAQIAAEEAADVILVGARARRRLRRGFESRLADRLETSTLVPVVIAPRRTRRSTVANDGGRR